MRKLLALFVTLMAMTPVFAELPVCPGQEPYSDVKEDEFCKVTHIRGPVAEEKYRSFESPEVEPRPNTFPQDYLEKAVILAKYSKELVCWKIQAPLYYMIDGREVYQGPEQCVRFSCNVIEQKQ